MTIHNIGYQGVFGAADVGDLDLGADAYLLHQDDLKAGHVNALKHGILHADAVTTVSPTYAREITTPRYGMGMEQALASRGSAVHGILNGVDYEEWDPAHDKHLPIHFGPGNIAQKAELKRNFLLRQGMVPTRGRVPLFGIVSRLASQKGFDLLTDTLPNAAAEQRCAARGGGHGRRACTRSFSRASPTKYRGRAWFFGGYDEALAHWIEGASDAFLMPSQYEPCGLNQMYSLRYGTVPIVRRTGGLADSVTHFDPATGEGTGIVFNDFDAIAMTWALDTAMSWYAQPALWERIVQNAMRCDFSWETQANEYLKLFADLLKLDAAALIKRDAPQKTAG